MTGSSQSCPPLFAIGAPRSGTSLLYKALCLHPDAAYISNWVGIFPAVPELAVLNRLARRQPARRRSVWFGGEEGNAYVYGRTRPALDRAFPQPVESEPVFAWAGVPDTPPPGEIEIRGDDRAVRRLRKVFGLITEWSGARCLVNKRIANNLRLRLLHEAFPDARFLDITRDGRAVALSCSRVDWWNDSRIWWYGGTPLDWEAEGRDPWELCGRHWVEELRAIERGLEAIPSEQVLRLSYEELVTDPIGTLLDIADFSGLGYDRSWHTELESLNFRDKKETWREKLPGDAAEVIATIQAEALRERGYVI